MGGEPRWVEAEVRRARRGWRVLIPCGEDRALEYGYATRRKARYMAAVFRLNPTWRPLPNLLVRCPPRAVQARRAQALPLADHFL